MKSIVAVLVLIITLSAGIVSATTIHVPSQAPPTEAGDRTLHPVHPSEIRTTPLSMEETSCNCTSVGCYEDAVYFWYLPHWLGFVALAQKIDAGAPPASVWVKAVSWYLYDNGNPQAYQNSSKVSVHLDDSGLPGEEVASAILTPEDYRFYPEPTVVTFDSAGIWIEGASYWVAIESFDPPECCSFEWGCPCGIRVLSDDLFGENGGGTCDSSTAVYYESWSYFFAELGTPNSGVAFVVDVEHCFQPFGVEYLTLGVEDESHVITHYPSFTWSNALPDTLNVDSFEIEVGTDNDWFLAEMWDPPALAGDDTTITYGGAPLLDGTTYFWRLSIHTEAGWTDWCESSFHMNSVPSIPVPLQPLNDVITDATPTLWIENSTDAEADALTYDFFCCVDTAYGEPDPVEGLDIPEGTDSTGWQVTTPLDENKRYWWRARSYDGYEYSDWMDLFTSAFFVDASPEAPSTPQANFPPDTGGMPVFDMLPTFLWSESFDPDPLDTVRYKLEIAVDPSFTYVNIIDSILGTGHTVGDSLLFGTHYWWRVTAWDKDGFSTVSWNTPDFWTWTLGDLDHDHDCVISDLTFLVAYLFSGGPAPVPEYIADVDGNCDVNIADLTYLVQYLFAGGPPPAIGCNTDLSPE